MHIRIVAVACLFSLLAVLQANAADQLIKLPKPAELEAATGGKAGVASAPAAPAAAPTDAAKAGTTAAAPEAAAASDKAASSPAKSAALAEAIDQASRQASAAKAAPKPAPSAASARAEEDEDQAIQNLGAKISARLLALRKRQEERKTQQAHADIRPARVHVVKASQALEVKPVSHGLHWDYEGEEGPSHWGQLNPAWATCDSGQRQSPIDIRDGIKLDLEKILFDYKPGNFSVIDNGHTVQVNVAGGNRITITGRTYELVQFHFHRPAEERINGRGFAMVVHLVHRDLEGRLAVVAVLIEEGAANGVVQTVWNNLPLEKNDPVKPAMQIDSSQLLPAQRDYYTYMGSLTTPPCSEGVLWLVMKQPIQLSSQQIAIFSRLYPMNARPIQADAGRMIKESN